MDVVIFLEYRANRSRPLPKTAALPFVSSFDTIHACYTQLLTVSQISLPLSHLNDCLLWPLWWTCSSLPLFACWILALFEGLCQMLSSRKEFLDDSSDSDSLSFIESNNFLIPLPFYLYYRYLCSCLFSSTIL